MSNSTIIKNALLSIIVTAIVACNSNQKKTNSISNDNPFEEKVDSILNLMTVEEKIGQLNLPSAGQFTTGQAKNFDIVTKIEKGLLGGLFNIKFF